MKVKSFFKRNAVADRENKPALGIRAMRDRLARTSEPFRAALDIDVEAEQFCREVRNNLRELRMDRGLEQSVLAKELDMTQSAVSKVETSIGDLGIKTVFRYAHALGLRPVCVFVPSAEQLIKEMPHRRSEAKRGSVVMTPAAAAAFEAVQVELVRSVSDSVSNVMNGLARTSND